MNKAHFGMIGLGTMGRNFLLNVAENGFSCVGYDLDEAKRRMLLEEGAGLPISAADSIKDLTSSLDAPRNVMLLVPAGGIVDSVIHDLLPHLEAGDLVIDGGNSHFLDTERREVLLREKGLEFMGVGVSGGEEGARRGASIMPGGRPEYYRRVSPIFEAVAAKVGGEPCVAYMGASSAGHFVKMVHNGIEYGLMQILAETYDFMRRVLKMDYAQMSETFAAWNKTRLNSFLVEITAEVLQKTDAETGRPLVEMILDKAAQKGTGKWTSQAAMDFGVPIPTIDSAVAMRQISAQKETRLLTAQKYGGPPSEKSASGSISSTDEKVSSRPQFDFKAGLARKDVETVVSLQQHEAIDEKTIAEASDPVENPAGEDSGTNVRHKIEQDLERFALSLENALLSSFIVTYAQGLSLLQAASIEKNYNLNLAEIARIWRGGCIIRSALLEDMRRALSEKPELPNLILDDNIAEILSSSLQDWRSIVRKFTESGVPALCLGSALYYFEAFCSARLPANLIQAQRDYFGAHTYQRVDKEGVFHTEWNE